MKNIKVNLKEELEGFKEQIVELIHETFDNDGEVKPTMFALIIHNDKLHIALLAGLAELFVSEKGKDIAADVIKDFTKDIKPMAIAFVSEGWMVESEININASESTARKEIIMINFETYDKESSVFLEILRDKTQASLKLIHDLDWRKKEKNSSRFSNLLEENYSELAQWVSKQLESKHNWN